MMEKKVPFIGGSDHTRHAQGEVMHLMVEEVERGQMEDYSYREQYRTACNRRLNEWSVGMYHGRMSRYLGHSNYWRFCERCLKDERFADALDAQNDTFSEFVTEETGMQVEAGVLLAIAPRQVWYAPARLGKHVMFYVHSSLFRAMRPFHTGVGWFHDVEGWFARRFLSLDRAERRRRHES